MDLKDHERWNEEMALKYNPDAFITKSGAVIRWVERRRLRLTKAMLDVRESDAVLDLGCGPGNLLPLLNARRVVGVDPSETLLAQARIRTQGNPKIQLVKAFAEKLPFSDDVFDRVVCSEVLEHVRQPEIVLDEIRRVAKPGARIVITVPNEELINFSKRWVLRLGLKKWIAGEYAMSDNMLEEWHVSEINAARLRKLTDDRLDFVSATGVPFGALAFHRIFLFLVK